MKVAKKSDPLNLAVTIGINKRIEHSEYWVYLETMLGARLYFSANDDGVEYLGELRHKAILFRSAEEANGFATKKYEELKGVHKGKLILKLYEKSERKSK